MQHEVTNPSSIMDFLVQDGAVPGFFHGQDVVVEFGNWQAEYWSLRQGAGLVPLGQVTEIALTGADRGAFLNRLATNRLDRLAVGSGAETFLTDAKGHVLAYAHVFAEPDRLSLFSWGDFGPRIVSHLDYYLIREKVELADRSPQLQAFLLAGRDTDRILASLRPEAWPGEPLATRSVEFGGTTITLRALAAGEPTGRLVLCPRAAASAVWSGLRQMGAEACGHRAAEAIRIEWGWPRYGLDITEANLPQEVARDPWTLSFNKGCYLGQETVARIDARGHVNKTLVGLKFQSSEPPVPGSPLAADGLVVGQLTSTAWSPGFQCAVALGYVRRGHNTAGSALTGDGGPAEVVDLPMRHLDA